MRLPILGARGPLLASHRLSPDTPPPTRPAPPTAGNDASKDREQRLAERMLEDERLPGNLDGATWTPVQAWLLEAIHRLAVSTAALDDAAAEPVLDAGERTLRSVAGTLVDAVEQGPAAPDFAARLEPLHHLLAPTVVPDGGAARLIHADLRAAARDLAANPATPLPTVAERLVAALTPAGPPPAG